MGYTAMKGGIEAIERAEALLREPDPDAAPVPSAPQIRDHLRASVDRAMGEGGLYDRELAALAVRQSEGDSMEATLLLRAYRSTLARLAYTEPCDGDEMDVLRRITPAFKSAPGGQLLGRTRDYSQRLLETSEIVSPGAAGDIPTEETSESSSLRAGSETVQANEHWTRDGRFPKLSAFLREEGLLEEQPADDATAPYDITRDPLRFPAQRSARLQALARGDSGAMVALAYSTMRGFGVVHSTLCELRVGWLPVRVRHPYRGEPVCIGEIEVTEVEDLNLSKHTGASSQDATRFSRGYGLVFGENERKAIAMALLDRAIESGNAGVSSAPAADEEFVLYHIDGVEGSGFLEHLKLPHYVEFQAYAQRMRALRAAAAEGLVPEQQTVALPEREPVAVSAGGARATTEEDEHARMHHLGIEHDHG
jgi:alpha-D-ribose 1-methylphosphonate 5-triphosphate synthase subunit PhnI